MRRFLVSKINLSVKKFYSGKGLEFFAEQYGAVVCSNDQMSYISTVRGFDSAFFLDFISGQTSTISYTASFSFTTYLEKYSK